VNGSLTTPPGTCTPLEGETSCPGDIGIGNSNQANISGTTDSSANTGGNQESGSGGSASIDTGDATASGEMKNDVNGNTVTATESSTLTPTPTCTLDECASLTPSPTPTLEGQPQASQTASQTSSGSPGSLESPTPTLEVKNLEVNNENNGKVANDADVSAQTGNNMASENVGGVDINTGDALAWANILNLINTNIVGSNFETVFIDINDESNGEVDLNELWKELQKMQGTDNIELTSIAGSKTLRLTIKNSNKADLENKVNVSAGTGGNEANDNASADVNTGDATALANVTNLVNTNLLGSKFFFGVINMFDQYKGNIILPRPERFLSSGSAPEGGNANFNNQNTATVEDVMKVMADTGNNTANSEEGENSISTGDANAVANNFSLLNLNIFQNDWFYLLLNALGNWQGKIDSWQAPGIVEENDEPVQSFSVGMGTVQGETQPQDVVDESHENNSLLNFQNENRASVKNDINVTAATGGNSASGNEKGATIQTGKAKAIANLINLVNLNILGGRWFMGLMNVLGNWSGNLVFAYPDTTVTLSGPEEVAPNDTFSYSVNYKNQGYDEAQGVVIRFEMPQGLDYQGDTSGLSPACSNQTCSWEIGNLGRDASGSFVIRVKLAPNFFDLQKLSWWEKLIPRAYAAENVGSFVVKVLVETADPESDSQNNSSTKTTSIMVPEIGGGDFNQPSGSNDQLDQRQPILEVTAENNVGEFVYPGDIVTFQITVWNKGEVPAKDAFLTQALYDGVPYGFGKAKIQIGTIDPGRKVKVSFGFKLSDEGILDAGPYHTYAQVFGYAPNGDLVSSNQARTDFNLHLRQIASVFEARAAAEEEVKVLGVESECPKPKDNVLPYVLLLALSSLWIVDRSRKLTEMYLTKKDEKI